VCVLVVVVKGRGSMRTGRRLGLAEPRLLVQPAGEWRGAAAPQPCTARRVRGDKHAQIGPGSTSTLPGRLPRQHQHPARAAAAPTSTPWLSMIFAPSICLRLFSRSVTPVLTRSRMMSAQPMAGAASSAPSALSSTTCWKPCSSK
jgi:hypothetical protein